jgi:hypothetical protein
VATTPLPAGRCVRSPLCDHSGWVACRAPAVCDARWGTVVAPGQGHSTILALTTRGPSVWTVEQHCTGRCLVDVWGSADAGRTWHPLSREHPLLHGNAQLVRADAQDAWLLSCCQYEPHPTGTTGAVLMVVRAVLLATHDGGLRGGTSATPVRRRGGRAGASQPSLPPTCGCCAAAWVPPIWVRRCCSPHTTGGSSGIWRAMGPMHRARGRGLMPHGQ